MPKDLPLNDRSQPNWLGKLTYSRSFLAKLILSDDKTKEYYAKAASKLLSCKKVRSHVRRSGTTFLLGRNIIAKIAFSGKTLCLYLALSPSDFETGKYKVTDASAIKNFAAVPSKLKIKSDGALNHALKLIDGLAEQKQLTFDPEADSVKATDFPTDTVENLIARGLIKVISQKDAPIREQDDTSPSSTAVDEIYRATIDSATDLTKEYPEYERLLSALKNGSPHFDITKKYILRSIDETWVKAVEDSLPALDEVIRNPSHFIEETEKILPIERTKKVTSRSIRHLSQHTDLISRIENGNVTPSKLLNVFRDDSIMTYENKFVNTLLNRLYTFVAVRYENAQKAGADGKVTSLEFNDSFVFDGSKAKVRLQIEITDDIGDNEKIKNYALNTELWKRVRKLYDVAKTYQGSEFVLSMGRTFIYPPIMHTNAILKNKNLRQCLALWEFIESYDEETGVIVDETAKDISAEHLLHIYQSVAEQYLVFCRNVNALRDMPESDEYPERFSKKDAFTQKEIVKVDAYSGVAANADAQNQPENADELLFNIEVALAADDIVEKDLCAKERRAKAHAEAEKKRLERERLAKEAEENAKAEALAKATAEKDASIDRKSSATVFSDAEAADTDQSVSVKRQVSVATSKAVVVYVKTFEAKLRLSSDAVKEYYCAVCNKLLSKEKVHARTSRSGTSFHAGRKLLAKITMSGAALKLHLALDPNDILPKYFAKDLSSIKKYKDVPTAIKIKSGRGLKHALELIDVLCKGLNDVGKNAHFYAPTDFPEETMEKLVAMGLAKKTVRTIAIETEATANAATEQDEAGVVRPAPLPFKKLEQNITNETDGVEKEFDLPELAKMSEAERKEFMRQAKVRLQAAKETEGSDSASDDTTENTAAAQHETEKADMTQAGGDPLLYKKDVADSISTIKLELPDEEKPALPDETQTSLSPDEVPVGGDALLIKPITLDELESNGKKPMANAANEGLPQKQEEVVQEKRNIFARLFRRRK